MGMRGIHDSGMQGKDSQEEKVQLLGKIILNQREILVKNINKPAENIPQVLTLYKEVLKIYNYSLEDPEDITLMWTDDNYGYIRRLCNKSRAAKERG